MLTYADVCRFHATKSSAARALGQLASGSAENVEVKQVKQAQQVKQVKQLKQLFYYSVAVRASAAVCVLLLKQVKQEQVPCATSIECFLTEVKQVKQLLGNSECCVLLVLVRFASCAICEVRMLTYAVVC